MTEGIARDRQRLEEHRYDVRAGNEEYRVALRRAREIARTAGLEPDDRQTEEKLPDALSSNGVAAQQVRGSGGQKNQRLRGCVETDAGDGQQAVDRGGGEPASNIRLGVG